MYLWFKFDYTCNILKKIIFETVVILGMKDGQDKQKVEG